MISFQQYLDQQLANGRAYFSREEGLQALGLNSKAFSAAVTRFIKKRRLASPKGGFYLILRPEDQVIGAPDPVCWIDPFMKYLRIDYRISLLRAAAFHGASHQAAMIFQVVIPKQLRGFEIGRHRLQFVYQSPIMFTKTNIPNWLGQIKSDAGFAQMAGVELTLLDSVRYFHKVAGLNGVAQMVHDLGAQAKPRQLAKMAVAYENSAVRRLGYFLDHFGHDRQAKALAPFASQAKSLKPLNPSVLETPVKSLMETAATYSAEDRKWMLILNQSVEIDI